jgi:hypothetical protein
VFEHVNHFFSNLTTTHPFDKTHNMFLAVFLAIISAHDSHKIHYDSITPEPVDLSALYSRHISIKTNMFHRQSPHITTASGDQVSQYCDCNLFDHRPINHSLRRL